MKSPLLLALLFAAYASAAKFNAILILADDLDLEMESSSEAYMPNLHALIAKQGATFSRLYTSTPVCCPSRSALYSGQYQHNNRVVGNSISTNCSSLAWQNGPETRSFATTLKAAGYATSFAGKYLNCYGTVNAGYVPPGWTDWHGLFGNSVYYNYTISNNGVEQKHGDVYPDDYLPSVILNHSVSFMRESVAAGQPFFSYLSAPSCHGPQEAAPQYQDMYPDARAPRTPNYNATVANAHWLQAVQGVYGLDANEGAFADLVYRRRLQAIKSLDDIVASVVEELTALGVLNSTYIFFSSDNGYHTGTFGLIYDKRQPWETDTHLPLYVRGPGVAAGSTVSALVTIPDLTATFADIGTGAVPPIYDGASLLPFFSGSAGAPPTVRQMDLIEYVGESDGGGSGRACARTSNTPLYCNPDGLDYVTPPFFNGSEVCVCQDATNNTYSCLRVVNATADYRYCEFVDALNTVEFFDYLSDPFELENKAAELPPARAAALHVRLTAARGCKGTAQCDALLTAPV